MGELARSKNTPATDAGFDLLSRIATDPRSDERYPDGAVIVPSDSPHTSALITRAISERKPIVLVFPDGSDVVARSPEITGLAMLVVSLMIWIVERVSRKRDRPTFVPRDWVTEFHAAPERDPELVG